MAPPETAAVVQVGDDGGCQHFLSNCSYNSLLVVGCLFICSGREGLWLLIHNSVCLAFSRGLAHIGPRMDLWSWDLAAWTWDRVDKWDSEAVSLLPRY